MTAKPFTVPVRLFGRSGPGSALAAQVMALLTTWVLVSRRDPLNPARSSPPKTEVRQ